MVQLTDWTRTLLAKRERPERIPQPLRRDLIGHRLEEEVSSLVFSLEYLYVFVC